MRPRTRCNHKPGSEAEITASIRHLLNTVGIWHWKQWQGMGSYKGVADILGIYRGRMIAIEIKKANGIVSQDQQRFLDRVNAEGGIGFVARSVDDVIDGLGIRDRYLL